MGPKVNFEKTETENSQESVKEGISVRGSEEFTPACDYASPAELTHRIERP
jgi:hypothetical protein